MRCSKCDSENRERRKFCANCGELLSVTCPKCGASNQPGEKFCGECGALLTASATAAGAKPQPTADSAIRIAESAVDCCWRQTAAHGRLGNPDWPGGFSAR